MRLNLTREQKIAARFLRGFRLVGDRLESSIVGLERAKAAQDSLGSADEGLGLSGGDHDKILNSIIRMDKALDEIEQMAQTFSGQFREIEDFISEVQRRDDAAGRVLRLTYINGLSADQIADREEMCCSKKTVYEHLRRGLDVAFDLLSRDGVE